MSQLDLDHDDYLKDNQEKSKFKAKHMTEEERNQRVLEQNQMFQKMTLEKGSASKLAISSESGGCPCDCRAEEGKRDPPEPEARRPRRL